MASSTKPSDNLDQLASDLRSQASVLESFAETLHREVAGLKWQGPAADKFREAIKGDQALLTQAIELARQLASRIQRLAEDAAAAEKKLQADQTALLAKIKGQIQEIEDLSKEFNVPVATLLADNPQFAAELKAEGAQYVALGGELSSIGDF